MRKHTRKRKRQFVTRFLIGFVIGMLIMILFPKVISHYAGSSEEPSAMTEQQENETKVEEKTPETEEKKPVRTTVTGTETPRRERCIYSNCLNERNATSRYCDEHDNGYRPRNTYSSSPEQTRDIDDQDIDSYYEDYKDEFVDIDDAWDDLEDYEDEWDD